MALCDLDLFFLACNHCELHFNEFNVSLFGIHLFFSRRSSVPLLLFSTLHIQMTFVLMEMSRKIKWKLVYHENVKKQNMAFWCKERTLSWVMTRDKRTHLEKWAKFFTHLEKSENPLHIWKSRIILYTSRKIGKFFANLEKSYVLF